MRYNPLEVNATGIVIFVTLVVVMVALVLPGVKLLVRHLETGAAQAERNPAETAIANSRTNFPTPREQVSAPADLAAFLAQQRSELISYGWIDRRGGVVRIPITRAMELFSERELSAHSNQLRHRPIHPGIAATTRRSNQSTAWRPAMKFTPLCPLL